MAGKRGINWEIEEARTWMSIFMKNYKTMDMTLVFKKISTEINKPYNSVKLRYDEIKRILGGEHEFPIVTPNFVQVVDETIASNEVSLNRLKMIFD
jgi:hypothetical protein